MGKLYPKTPSHFDAGFPDVGMAGSMVESIGHPGLARQSVEQLNPPRAPRMQKAQMPADYAGMFVNAFTNPEPGAESDLPRLGTGALEGSRKLSTPGQRLQGAAQLMETGGEAISPLMGLAPIEALGAASSQAALTKAATLAAGFGTGYVGSKGAEKLTRRLGGGPDAQALAAQAGFWLPAMAGAGLSALVDSGEVIPRQRALDHITQSLITQGGVDERLARTTAQEMVLKYEATGDARFLNAENVTTPSAQKVLGLMAERAAMRAGEVGKSAVLGHGGKEDELKNLWTDERGTLLKPDGSLFTKRDYDAASNLNEQLAKAATRPTVGGVPTVPKIPYPSPESIQTSGTTTRSGEPFRAPEGPSVEELTKNMTVEQKVASNQRIAAYIDRTNKAREETLAQIAKPERDTTAMQKVQAEHPDWTLSQQLQEAARNVQPGKGLAVSNITLEARTQDILKRHPNMAEGTARALARQAMEKERGSLSLRPATPQVGPKKAGLAWRAGDALESVTKALGSAFGDLDAVSDPERKARLITRGIDSERKLLNLQLEEKLKTTIEAHDNDGKTDFQAFMDAGEGKPGSQFLKPEDQITATQLHNEFQKRWVKINDILDRDQNAGIDNYLSHLWKRPNQALDKLGQYMNARRPVEGKGGFLKQRFYQYASDGLNAGLEPLSMNPIRMQLAALNQVDKFITAHELKDAYKEAGIVQFVKAGSDIPQGYQKLNDKLFDPMFFKEGLLSKRGTYYAPPEVARIFNRYLDPGLSGNLAYDALRNYGNMLNQVNLGLSGYHGSFITIVAGSSDVALGLEKIINNHDVGGINNILRGTVGTFSAPFDLAIQGIADKLGKSESVESLVGSSSAGRFYRRGRQTQKEALSPSLGPKTREQQLLATYVQELVQSGATFKQDQFYRTPEGQRFFKTLFKTPWKVTSLLQAGVQRFPITRGIMDYYVPRVKIGMASYMMEAKLQELVKNGVYDEGSIRTEMSKIWDSVDNRAGQMKYDNLFWNRSAKDLSFLAVRAVGWDLGTVREIGGAGVDVLSGASKLLKGEKPSTVLSGRAAFVLGSTITLGTIGAAMTYLATGKAPQNALDYFYPPTGRTGTNGKPERYALPTYAKDVVNFWNKPAKTIVGKLHPSVEQLYEFYNNRDFQDTQIYDRGGPDPLYKKGYDILHWWAKTATPFAVTTALARERGGEGLGPQASRTAIALESFSGLQRASREISSSAAEDYIFENDQRYWEAGPVGREDRERRELFFKFRTQQRLGTLDDNTVGQALDEGKLRDSDYNRIFQDEGLTDSQSEFKFLASHDLSTAIKALQLMKPEERGQYRDQVDDAMKGGVLKKYTFEEQMQYMDEIDKLMDAVPQ